MIHVNDKDFVVPGQLLAEEDCYSGRGTYKDAKKVISSLTGLVSLRNKKISVIPLKSKYVPKRGDVVIGEISDVRFSLWELDLNSPYSGILPASEVFGREKKDLNRVFRVGDVLFLKVVDVDEVKKVKLGLKGRGMGKFRGGILVDIAPTKVPRLIGKKGSMINMIKDKTKCKIVVGQNGLVWIRGDKEMEIITKNIINIIEAKAHTSGLTNHIRDQLYLLVDGEIPPEISEAKDENITHDESNEYYDESNEQDYSSNINQFENNLNQENHTNSSKDSFELDENGLEKPKLQNFKDEIEFELKEETIEKSIENDKIQTLDIKEDIKEEKIEFIQDKVEFTQKEKVEFIQDKVEFTQKEKVEFIQEEKVEFIQDKVEDTPDSITSISTNNIEKIIGDKKESSLENVQTLDELKQANKDAKEELTNQNNIKNTIPTIKPVIKSASFFNNYRNIKKDDSDDS